MKPLRVESCAAERSRGGLSSCWEERGGEREGRETENHLSGTEKGELVIPQTLSCLVRQPEIVIFHLCVSRFDTLQERDANESRPYSFIFNGMLTFNTILSS